MRIVYFGSGQFSVPSLRAVLAGGHDVAAVFTQPARPAGRSGAPRRTPVAEAASAAGATVIEAENINAPESVARLRSFEPDVIAVADFGQILRRGVLEAPKLCPMNLHASLLPELRGAAPINWAILRGCRTTGLTTFRIVRAMDAGPIYLTQRLEIGPEETAEELKARLAEAGAGLMARTLDLLASGAAGAYEQDHSAATRAPMLEKSDGLIDWSADAATIGNLVRGTWPWPGGQAGFEHAGRAAMPMALARAVADQGEARGRPGEVDEELLVATGQGRLRVLEIRPAGKRLMSWRDFVNGYRVKPGDRFVRAEP